MTTESDNTNDDAHDSALDAYLASPCQACAAKGIPYDPNRHDSQNCWVGI